MNEVFELQGESNCNLKYTLQCTTPNVNTVYHRTEFTYCLVPKIWKMIPSEIKGKSSVIDF